MANAGVCSRREADELITKGLVKVNGEVVTELGVKITAKDTVEYNDKIVTSERKIYILLNKPKDCVTTSDDPNGRKTVMDIVKGACEERIYPVGRLDRNTTGVLLLTNDGNLASKLTHPKFVKKKIYQVWTDKPISEEDMQHIADGVELDDESNPRRRSELRFAYRPQASRYRNPLRPQPCGTPHFRIARLSRCETRPRVLRRSHQEELVTRTLALPHSGRGKLLETELF